MAVPCSLSMYIMSMVWMALSAWVSSCLTVANEIAQAFRSGDMGPFHVG